MRCPYHDMEISEEECRQTRFENADRLGSPCMTCPFGREESRNLVQLKGLSIPDMGKRFEMKPRSKMLRDNLGKRSPSDWVVPSDPRFALSPEPARLCWAIQHIPDTRPPRRAVGLRAITKNYNSVSVPRVRLSYEDMGTLLENYGLEVRRDALGADTPGLMLNSRTKLFLERWSSLSCVGQV